MAATFSGGSRGPTAGSRAVQHLSGPSESPLRRRLSPHAPWSPRPPPPRRRCPGSPSWAAAVTPPPWRDSYHLRPGKELHASCWAPAETHDLQLPDLARMPSPPRKLLSHALIMAPGCCFASRRSALRDAPPGPPERCGRSTANERLPAPKPSKVFSVTWAQQPPGTTQLPTSLISTLPPAWSCNISERRSWINSRPMRWSS